MAIPLLLDKLSSSFATAKVLLLVHLLLRPVFVFAQCLPYVFRVPNSVSRTYNPSSLPPSVPHSPPSSLSSSLPSSSIPPFLLTKDDCHLSFCHLPRSSTVSRPSRPSRPPQLDSLRFLTACATAWGPHAITPHAPSIWRTLKPLLPALHAPAPHSTSPTPSPSAPSGSDPEMSAAAVQCVVACVRATLPRSSSSSEGGSAIGGEPAHRSLLAVLLEDDCVLHVGGLLPRGGQEQGEGRGEAREEGMAGVAGMAGRVRAAGELLASVAHVSPSASSAVSAALLPPLMRLLLPTSAHGRGEGGSDAGSVEREGGKGGGIETNGAVQRELMQPRGMMALDVLVSLIRAARDAAQEEWEREGRSGKGATEGGIEGERGKGGEARRGGERRGAMRPGAAGWGERADVTVVAERERLLLLFRSTLDLAVAGEGYKAEGKQGSSSEASEQGIISRCEEAAAFGGGWAACHVRAATAARITVISRLPLRLPPPALHFHPLLPLSSSLSLPPSLHQFHTLLSHHIASHHIASLLTSSVSPLLFPLLFLPSSHPPPVAGLECLVSFPPSFSPLSPALLSRAAALLTHSLIHLPLSPPRHATTTITTTTSTTHTTAQQHPSKASSTPHASLLATPRAPTSSPPLHPEPFSSAPTPTPPPLAPCLVRALSCLAHAEAGWGCGEKGEGSEEGAEEGERAGGEGGGGGCGEGDGSGEEEDSMSVREVVLPLLAVVGEEVMGGGSVGAEDTSGGEVEETGAERGSTEGGDAGRVMVCGEALAAMAGEVAAARHVVLPALSGLALRACSAHPIVQLSALL
ncbi:unnamed protein product [Closterium sp. NIES-54]